MPYTIRHVGNKWIVSGPSGVKGRHDTRREAEAQRKALYANEAKR